jgi:hypothetical protein
VRHTPPPLPPLPPPHAANASEAISVEKAIVLNISWKPPPIAELSKKPNDDA